MIMTFTQITEKTDQEIIEIYLDWVNNFISLEKFAEHYGLDEIDANYVIELGRNLNNLSRIKSLYREKESFETNEVKEIINFIENGHLSTDEMFEDFENWLEEDFDDFTLFEYKDYYQNLLTHKENLRLLKIF